MWQGKIRVLFVDDEKYNLSVFRAGFRDKYEIYTATSAKKAYDILNRIEIPIVIADSRMPQITGIEFLSVVRNMYPNSIRILVTGYSDIESVINSINKGGVSFYISKPWSEQEIISCIDQGYKWYAQNKIKEAEIENLNHKLNELSQKLNNEFETYSIFINQELRTAIKQYLTYFKDFVKQSKNKEI